MGKVTTIILKTIAVQIILGIFVVAGFMSKQVQEPLECKGIEVCVHDSADVTFIGSLEVASFIKRSRLNPVGKKMSSIDTEKLEELLRNNPVIKKVQCYKTVGGSIGVDIYQREPILRIMSTMYGSFYVDRDGHSMPVSVHYSVPVPLASGYITKDFAQKDLYELALFLEDNPFWNAQISQIYVYPNKDISLIPRVGDHEIILGGVEELDQKFDNLLLFYKKGLNEIGWNRFRTVSLKFKNQIVCTQKDKKNDV